MLRKSVVLIVATALAACHGQTEAAPATPPPKPAPVAEPPPPAAPLPPPAPSVSTPPPPESAPVDASAPEFVALAGGRFHYGCEPQDTECKDLEKPGSEENIAPFKLMKTEVTVAEYGACVSAGKCTAPRVSNNPEDKCNWLQSDRSKDPINCVNWAQAKAYCAFIGGHLPTTKEWEWAAKSGKSHVYPWGNDAPDFSRAQYQRLNGTAPVGSYPTGDTEQGIHDLAGNVWEWTDNYAFDGKLIEVRGGGWRNPQTYLMRTSHRGRRPPDAQDDFVGFRCAK